MRFNTKSNPERNRFLENGSDFIFNDDSKSAYKRSVPLGIIIRIFFSDAKGTIGLAFTLMGGIFVVVFGAVMLSTKTNVSDGDPIAPGIITKVDPTGTTINDQTLYKYYYEFQTPKGNNIKSHTKAFWGIAKPGDTIDIQYKPEQPEESRFADYTEEVFPAWIMLFLFIFPAVGLVLLFSAIRKAIRSIKVLKVGETAWGQYAGQEATNTKINNQTVYRLFFKFTAPDGNEYTAVGTTHRTYRLRDEEQELVVFDPKDPSNAFPADAFPQAVKQFLTEK